MSPYENKFWRNLGIRAGNLDSGCVMHVSCILCAWGSGWKDDIFARVVFCCIAALHGLQPPVPYPQCPSQSNSNFPKH